MQNSEQQNQYPTRHSRASFKDADSYLYSQRIDESILDNFDEQDTPSAVSRISTDVTGSFSCSALVVLHVKSGLTASYSNIRQISERLFDVSERSRLFKDCLVSTIILKTKDDETNEDAYEEYDPNEIPDGYQILIDFLKKHKHNGLATVLPDAEISFDISFNPAQNMNFEKYAYYMSQYIDKVSSVVTRASKDFGHISFYAYNTPNEAVEFKFFEAMKIQALADAYRLFYSQDVDVNEELENKIQDTIRQKFTKALPNFLKRAIAANERMSGEHGVWIDYESFDWIEEHSLLIRAHARQRFANEPLSISNILFTLVRTLIVYFPDSITTTNAICISVTADDTIIDVNNKVPSIGRPDQTRFKEDVLINTTVKPKPVDILDGDKVVYNNRFISVCLDRGPDMRLADIPVGVMFPLKNGHIAKNWYNYKIKYCGSLRHNEWFQPFLDINLS